MGFSLTLFLILVSLPAILAQELNFAKIVIDGTTEIAETDDTYICATIDWWPSDYCRYGFCTWQNASAITMVRNLENFMYMSSHLNVYDMICIGEISAIHQ